MPQEIRITRNAYDKYEIIVSHNDRVSSEIADYEDISATIARLVKNLSEPIDTK